MRVHLSLLTAVALAASLLAAAPAAAQAEPTEFYTVLEGGQEVPPVTSDGGGAAAFSYDAHENVLFFVLLTYRLEEITAAHIHLGNPGENGPVVVTLFADGITDPGLPRDGVLSEGTIDEDDVGAVAAAENPCAPADFGGTMAELLAEMRAGCAHVNVHTGANPGGEIRGAIGALEPPTTPGGTFTDDDGSIHEGDIETAAAAGIARGFGDGTYRPELALTREQMASLIVRAFGIPPSAEDPFADDETSVHEDDINSLAAVGVTRGCTADGTRFCPADPVTREQLASFLARALRLRISPTDFFTDDEGSIHEEAINAAAFEGITGGCTADGTRFCPADPVTRGQAASFLVRSLGLVPLTPP